jgi:hypothetical protein
VKLRWHFVSLALLILLMSACSPHLTQYVLEVSGGTYAQQQNLGSTDVSLGTSIVVKVRTETGASTTKNASVVLRGPAGWNGDKVSPFVYPAQAVWVVAPVVTATPVAGQYQIDVSIDGQVFSKTFAIADAAKHLELTTISASLEGNAPNQMAHLTWIAVPNATGYYAKVIDTTSGFAISGVSYSLEPHADVMLETLNPSHAYAAVVYAASMDTVSDNPSLPSQFDVSDSFAALNAVPLNSPIKTKLRSSFLRDGFAVRGLQDALTKVKP